LTVEPIVSPSPSSPPRSEAEQIVLLTKELEWSRLKIQALEERLRLEMIRKYGAKSEKLRATSGRVITRRETVTQLGHEVDGSAIPNLALKEHALKENAAGERVDPAIQFNCACHPAEPALL
jgi:hypothetical protein